MEERERSAHWLMGIDGQDESVGVGRSQFGILTFF